MLSVFANLRINDQERLQHFKDSLDSFSVISDNWVVNVRGTLRNEAIAYLKNKLGEKLTLFELLEDSRGWMNNALRMVPAIKHNYVLAWVEDHVNLANPKIYKDLIKEMETQKADYMLYSWWLSGDVLKIIDKFGMQDGKYLKSIHITRAKWNKIRKAGYRHFLVSMCGIFRKELFSKLLKKDRIKLPHFFSKNLYRILVGLNYLGISFDKKKAFAGINKICFNIFPHFPKETPFNIEKPPYRTDILPLTIALPKQELFACIDDDLGTPGYSLIKRGLYPKVEKLTPINKYGLIESNADYEVKKIKLSKGEKYEEQYYEDENRTKGLLKNTLAVLKGRLLVAMDDEKIILEPGAVISIYPNLNYSISSMEDTDLVVTKTSRRRKNIKYLKRAYHE